MKKALLALSILVLLTACVTSVDKNDIADEGDDDYYGPTPDAEVEDFTVGETVNADGSYTFSVLSDGEEVATIEKEKPSDGYSAYIFDEIDSFVYVAIDPTGLGGYILYGGAFELYRVDTSTGTVEEIEYEGLATDLSYDGEKLAIVYNYPEAGLNVQVKGLQGGKTQNFSVAGEFDQAGDATFNLDGTKLAYQATITSDGSSEETAVFVIDLVTGEQTEFARQEGLYEIEWQDNDRPIVD